MSTYAVCILTAGRGTRMGTYCASLNKALLPLNKKAIISHIIEKFPVDTEFVVAVGHLKEQVTTYLRLAYPERTFRFVDVDNFEGPGSGPGYSLSCCRKHLEKPFMFVACDTLWDSPSEFPLDHDWFGVAPVPAAESAQYCNFAIEDNHIVAIRDKETVFGPTFRAFVGLGFIKSYDIFWNALNSSTLIKGEKQVSNGIRALVENVSPYAVEIGWVDVGNNEKYEQAVRRYENFDFSKTEEAIYLVNGKVIKYFADPKIAQKRVQRAQLNPSVFPAVSKDEKGFYAYPMREGNTLYESCTPRIFRNFLTWLEKNLWHPVEVDQDRVSDSCSKFYHEKTTQRLKIFHEKFPQLHQAATINEERVPLVDELLALVPWQRLSEGRPVFFHGDLQFDNVLIDPRDGSFTLLDWRQDFAGTIEFGDLYYDLGKLLGGIILNYDLVKDNKFSYIETNGEINIDFAQRFQSDAYAAILQEFIEKNNLDWQKVRLLVPIIFLNMSPLHHYPFNTFLYALGRLLLHRELLHADNKRN